MAPFDACSVALYLSPGSLVPELKPGDVVMLDNLSSHKQDRTRELIEAAGASLVCLPPYSPDLDPIEMVFGKM